jgi:two-component system, LytTR family, sensor kinase
MSPACYYLHLYMPFKLKQLSLFFIPFYFCWTFAMEFTNGNDLDFIKGYFTGKHSLGLIITTILSFFLYSLAAYFFLWFFAKKGNHLWGYLFILVCIPLIIMFRYFLQEIFAPAFLGFHNYYSGIKLTDYMMDNKYYSVYYSGFGIIFYYLQSNRYKDFVQQELKIQNRQAELDYLKSQVNPHFLFNNLNNIYSLIYNKSGNALSAVEKLSNLLRYMLYEKKEKVLLTEEITYLQNFIDLQKFRYDYDLPLSVRFVVNDKKLEIAPLLLIPLIENAFKHGDFKDREFPLVIDLQTRGNELSFTVKNKKGQYEKDKIPGIGVANLKRRLELLYAGKHELIIADTESGHTTQLKINL